MVSWRYLWLSETIVEIYIKSEQILIGRVGVYQNLYDINNSSTPADLYGVHWGAHVLFFSWPCMIVKIMGAASTAKPYTGGGVYGIAYWFVLTYQ